MNTAFRRLAALALVAGSIASLAPIARAAEPRTLVLSTYGLNNDLFRKDVYAPFEARCGCRIVLETGNSAERLAKLEAHREHPNVDLVQTTDVLALEASNKGLLQTLDYARINHLDQIYDFGRDPLHNRQAVAYTVYSVGLVVRTDRPSASITSWKDLWRPDLAGHLLLADISSNQGLAQLFMADRSWGGLSTDMGTGFARLRQIRDNAVTFYAQTAQMTALFAQDEAWVAPVGRFGWLNLKKTGKPLKWVLPKEGQVGMMNVMSIVKGSPNTDLAYQLIGFWLSKEVQTALANDLADSPINREATPTAQAADALTWGPAQIGSLVFMRTEMVARERAGWVAQWNRLVGQ